MEGIVVARECDWAAIIHNHPDSSSLLESSASFDMDVVRLYFECLGSGYTHDLFDNHPIGPVVGSGPADETLQIILKVDPVEINGTGLVGHHHKDEHQEYREKAP
jgi:hypothetical protein